MKNTYLCSVCIAVYNSEEFLDEAARSVIAQTIGFEDNLQLIFVNDGSTDGSEEICLSYKNNYPDNVLYLRQDNSGVSSAINRAILSAEGKYFAFLDADDLWNPDYLKNALSFFEDHYDDIDLVSTKIRIFGDRSYDHPMNYKYETTRIIDLNKEPFLIQTTRGNAIFKTQAIKTLRFDENVRIHEDILFNTMFLMKRNKYGVVKDSVYYYRKLNDTSSLSSGLRENTYWYLDIPEKVYMPLIKQSLELYGNVTPYVQEVLLYAVKWRLKVPLPVHILDSDQQKRFIENIRTTVQYIDDDRIMKIKNMPVAIKSHLLGFKYGENAFDAALLGNDGRLTYKDKVIYNFGGLGIAKITGLKEMADNIQISGITSCRVGSTKAEMIVKDNKNKDVSVKLCDDHDNDIVAFNGERIVSGTRFEIKAPKKRHVQIRLFIKTDRSDKMFAAKFSRAADLVEAETGEGDKLIIENSSKYSAVLQNHTILSLSKAGLF